jgi:hypothetical protein
MVRFIFVCMGVVALSLLSIAGQFIVDGISGAQQQIAARNDAAPDVQAVAVQADEPSAEDLNAIEAAAGAGADEPGNQTFGEVFSDEAPKALKDEEAAPVIEAAPAEDAAN